MFCQWVFQSQHANFNDVTEWRILGDRKQRVQKSRWLDRELQVHLKHTSRNGTWQAKTTFFLHGICGHFGGTTPVARAPGVGLCDASHGAECWGSLDKAGLRQIAAASACGRVLRSPVFQSVGRALG